MKEKILIIDGDILFYLASCVSEDSIDWGDDVASSWADEDNAILSFDQQYASIVGKRKLDRVIVAKSDDEVNFRKQLEPTYKANRKDSAKPALLKFIKEYAIENYDVMEKPRLEADDLLGIVGTDTSKDVLMWSRDKDLMQIPGKHLITPKKVVKVTPEEGEIFFLTQVLTGDPVDNYKGCPGIGPVKAAAILDCDPSERWERIVDAYTSKGLTEEDALLQARLARILRWGDYRIKDAKVKLWNPN